MRPCRSVGFVLALLMTGTLACGCYAFIGRYGTPFYDGEQPLSIQEIVQRFGQRHLDPATHQPHRAEFKLYDPYFETLRFKPSSS